MKLLIIVVDGMDVDLSIDFAVELRQFYQKCDFSLVGGDGGRCVGYGLCCGRYDDLFPS